MTLSFSKENIKKRFFIEKIWKSIVDNRLYQKGSLLDFYDDFLYPSMSLLNRPSEACLNVFGIKNHTIRGDPKNRWKEGNKIHFVMNNRQPNRFQFAPVIKCKFVQKIVIDWDSSAYIDIDSDIDTHLFINKGDFGRDTESDLMILVDKKRLPVSQWKELAINDGFDSLEEFLTYFNSDFKGNIIHWTDLKY